MSRTVNIKQKNNNYEALEAALNKFIIKFKKKNY